jgi:nitrogen fixation protein
MEMDALGGVGFDREEPVVRVEQEKEEEGGYVLAETGFILITAAINLWKLYDFLIFF